MGTQVTEQRNYKITFRLTAEEKQQLICLMEKNGYLSMSRFLRVRCLDGKTAVSRGRDSDGTDLRTQINILSREIARIGDNYNGVVRDFRSLLALKKRDGSMVVNTKTATLFLQQLNTYTIEVKALMEHIIGVYENNRHA